MGPKASPADTPDDSVVVAAPPARPKLSEIVSEGLYIASAAIRLSLKNRILMDTIGGGAGYDVDKFMPDARAALLALADEADAAAERIKKERKDAWHRFSDPDGTHDYGSRDVGNLRRRRRQSQRVAKELRARAEDDQELRRLVEAARDAAWSELAENIDRSLRVEAARPDLEPGYEKMREARMQALRLVDLSKLSAVQRQRRATEAERAESVGVED
ncbi:MULTISPECIES: asparagine synthase [unclassified Microbacterium]|uniref:asparagine synthase n=1 Tax=unclassified Microbacterium TaxID=2609290 RepID=UPI001E4AB933|nr:MULTISPECIES: asparagine synthase [unclassified Microbacterium]